MTREETLNSAYRAWRKAAEKGYGRTTTKSAMDKIDARIRKLKAKYEQAAKELRANPIRTAPKSAIPAKFVTAKVRRVGSKVQILLNK